MSKNKSAFRNIAEVTQDVGVATHVLRFWETKFSQVKPMKTQGSRRYYRPEDVEILLLIKELLHNRRYTIEGVQKLFKERSIKDILGTEIQKDFFEEETPICNSPETNDIIKSAIDNLTSIKNELYNLSSL